VRLLASYHPDTATTTHRFSAAAHAVSREGRNGRGPTRCSSVTSDVDARDAVRCVRGVFATASVTACRAAAAAAGAGGG